MNKQQITEEIKKEIVICSCKSDNENTTKIYGYSKQCQEDVYSNSSSPEEKREY